MLGFADWFQIFWYRWLYFIVAADSFLLLKSVFWWQELQLMEAYSAYSTELNELSI